MPTETEKAYFAGILDGEGSIGLYTHNQPPRKYHLGFVWTPYIRIYLSKGKEVLEDIVKAYNGRLVFRKASEFRSSVHNQNILWCALFDSCKKIKPLLLDLMPYLRIKKQQAELLLHYCNLRGGVNTPVEKDLAEIVAISEKIKELNTGYRINSRTKAPRKKWERDNVDSCSF